MSDYSESLPKGYRLQGKTNTYIIDRVLGQGAFGITYLARYKSTIQGSMGRGTGWIQVAVKEFFMRDLNVRDGSTGYLNDVSRDSLIGRYRRAFMREARNLSELHHENIINVFELIETNNTVYIVMEYINGGSLDEYIAGKGHLSEQVSTANMLKLCSAVGCMHDNRMLHLDIKPKNVMLDEDGQLYLIDFGLSKQYNSDGEPESSTSIGLGTPGYAPVEQSVHQENDIQFHATLDVYALGATMYKMLTGITPPYAPQVSDSVLNGDNIIRKQLKAAGISDGITAIVTKAMWPSSRGRYQSVKELEDALKEVQTNNHKPTADGDGEQTIVVPENPVPHKEPEHTHNPEQEQKHKPEPEEKPVLPPPSTPKGNGFPKWLYAVIAALVVGIIVLLSVPKSKTLSNIAPDIVKDTIETPVSTPPSTPAQAPEPVAEPQNEPEIVLLSSISLNRTTLTLEEGMTSNLTVRYTPSDATDKSTTWKSTDTKVVSVNSNGHVTAIKAGSAAIVAAAGGKEAYCNVTVTAKPQPVPQQVSTTTGTSSTGTTSASQATASSVTSGTGTNNGHEWVDLGLSVKWATCNVGASSPSAYGDYYAWGETSTKSSYTWENYRFRTSGNSWDNVKFSKYNTQSGRGTVDNRSTLELSDDVARQKWGGSWRMPTRTEFDELLSNCTWTWTTMNGVNGYKVTSKKSGYTNRSIFLPAAGCRDGTSLGSAGSNGYYWSGSLSTGDPSSAWFLGFDSDYHVTVSNYRRSGQSVRPVCLK